MPNGFYLVYACIIKEVKCLHIGNAYIILQWHHIHDIVYLKQPKNAKKMFLRVNTMGFSEESLFSEHGSGCHHMATVVCELISQDVQEQKLEALIF